MKPNDPRRTGQPDTSLGTAQLKAHYGVTEEEARALLDEFKVLHPEIYQNVGYFARFTKDMAGFLLKFFYRFPDNPQIRSAIQWTIELQGEPSTADALLFFAVRDLFRAHRAGHGVLIAERIVLAAWLLRQDAAGQPWERMAGRLERPGMNGYFQAQSVAAYEQYFFDKNGKTRFQARVESLRAEGFTVTTFGEEIMIECPDDETEVRIRKALNEMFAPSFMHPDLVLLDVNTVTESPWKK